MSLDEKENYGQEDQFFQNDRKQYDDPDIDSPPDHTITENAEPDYNTDLVSNRDELEEEDDYLENDLEDDDDDDLEDDDEDSEDDDIEEETNTYDKE
ncbi:hypothetical protein [Flavobacterium sp. ACN6]|uniref:hypothetical protein n=1 Tax=Flavobacterium sp. ACN6 TaxID=1920426 RepID=UPI000BB3E100|nr:hypothetical protein [Flavobacterium sp. ACN6]PBJ10181.1 hypothetical protein BSF42_32500 [Flavobacterium sp. ACN6]